MSVFHNFFVSVFVSVNGIKIFPLTGISVSVYVNHTGSASQLVVTNDFTKFHSIETRASDHATLKHMARLCGHCNLCLHT